MEYQDEASLQLYIPAPDRQTLCMSSCKGLQHRRQESWLLTCSICFARDLPCPFSLRRAPWWSTPCAPAQASSRSPRNARCRSYIRGPCVAARASVYTASAASSALTSRFGGCWDSHLLALRSHASASDAKPASSFEYITCMHHSTAQAGAHIKAMSCHVSYDEQRMKSRTCEQLFRRSTNCYLL